MYAWLILTERSVVLQEQQTFVLPINLCHCQRFPEFYLGPPNTASNTKAGSGWSAGDLEGGSREGWAAVEARASAARAERP